ncbi:MAG: hypothetical protein ACKO91_16390 [Acidimicrobiales bacterium]
MVGIVGSFAWIVAAAIGAGHGLDISDEGFYLLSYRWWQEDLRNFTGAQFVIGPVFQLLGYDVHLLRLARLAAFVIVHVLLGLSVARWLDASRPPGHASGGLRLAPVAVVAIVVAGGGFVYTWLPASPGYNDVALIGSILLTAITVELCVRSAAGRAIPWWIGVGAGAVAAVMALSKWSSAAVCVATVAVAGLVVVRPWKTVARLGGYSIIGALGLLLLVHLTLVDLTEVLPLLVDTNRAVGQRSNSVMDLLSLYVRNSRANLRLGVETYPLLVVTPVALAVLPGRRGRGRLALTAVAVVVTVVSLVVTAVVAVRRGALVGGTVNLNDSVPLLTTLLALYPIVLVAWAVRWAVPRLAARPSTSASGSGPVDRSVAARTGVVVVAVLLAMPFCQAAGTGNPILLVTLHGGGCWIAAGVVLASVRRRLDLRRSDRLAPVCLAVAVAMAVLGVSFGVTGSLLYPYRAGGSVGDLNRQPREAAAVSSVRLTPRDAGELDRLHRELKPWIRPAGRRILAFNEAAGLVFALDGRSVGESWYSGSDEVRTGQGIRDACPDGVPPWGDRLPLVLLRAPVEVSSLSEGLLSAMNHCGMRFPDGYVEIGRSSEFGLVVLGPR